MYSDLINTLLEKRGLKTTEDKDKFLNPSWDRDLLDPFHMKDMDKSVERIYKAIINNEKIIVYSDYDCDGIPGGVVMYDFFLKIEEGINVKKYGFYNKDLRTENKFIIDFANYIPHRHNEGYGVNQKAIEKFIKDKVSLMITVDLGITNIKEIKFAQDNNIDVIVTDHHLPLRNIDNIQVLPESFAIINTKQDDCKYKEKMLCGCATAWKLANAFLVKHREEFGIKDGVEKWWLDMVGISTIADMVPLIGENRLLAKYGIDVLRKSQRPGLRKILNNAKVVQKDLTETDIGFSIAPRLNAAGRMSDPKEAFSALLNNQESIIYADRLEKYNKNRKKETSMAHESIDFNNFIKDKIILVGNKDWTPGVLGLIASKIVDKTGKTTFVWGKGEDENIMKGSVRAGSDGANVVELMSLCSDSLLMFGGHEEAGGFAVHKDKLESFKNDLNIAFEKIKDSFTPKNDTTFIDSIVSPKDIGINLYNDLKRLSPFGIGNVKPIFGINCAQISHRVFGDKGQHVELNIDGVSAVKFNVEKDEIEDLLTKTYFVGEIDWDNYKRKVRLKLL